MKTITTTPTSINALASGQAARAYAVFKTTAGSAIPNALVTFILSDASLVTMSPASGTALTNAAGVAYVDIVANSPNVGGVLSITAKAVSGTETITSSAWNVAVAVSTASTTTTPSIALQVLSNATGLPTTVQSAGEVLQAKATVLQSDGTPVVNQLVSFKLGVDTALTAMMPLTGNALTNSNGVASVTLTANVPSPGGVYKVDASTTVSGVTLTTVASNVQVGLANIVLGTPTLASGTPSPLPANSTASIQSTVTSNGISVNTAPASAFTATSPCSLQVPAKAKLTIVGLSNGVFTTNYQNLGCATSPDTVSISMAGAPIPVSVPVYVSSALNSELRYIGAMPASNVLVVKGASGAGRQEAGVVSFKLLDTTLNPVSGATVQFSLNTIAGGITLSATSALTDASGVASVIVYSGSLPTPLTVLAKVVNGATTLTAASSVLSISAGPPEQRSISLSVEKRAIEGWNIDGITSAITIRMADYWGNAVPDNTAVSFISEGASISNSGTANGSCLTLNGVCSVTFTSQNFRPSNGRVSISAYAEGIEGFTDANGNGVFDTGESCFHAGAPYLDNDDSGTYSAGDLRITNIAPSTDAAKTATPCTARAATYVFGQTMVVLSSSIAVISRVSPVIAPSFAACTAINYQFMVSDTNGNSMAEGSTVGIADTDKVTVATIYPAIVPSRYTPSIHSVRLSPDTASCGLATPPTALFNIVVTSPSGTQTVQQVMIPY